MLVDLDMDYMNTVVGMNPLTQVLVAIGGGGSGTPTRLAQGKYEISHFSFGQVAYGLVHEWEITDMKALTKNHELRGLPIGVCDSPEQFDELFFNHLEMLPTEFVVSFTRVHGQPESGGWRWHKWGEYVGNHKPQCEYLYDEPDIDEVYVYQVYELKEQTPKEIES